jgi:hypothetical protein
MRNFLAWRVCLVAAATTFGATAWAGYKAPLGVFIFPHNLQGSLGGTRASADNVQYIGCQLHAGAYGAGGMCYARTLETYKACYFTDPAMFQVVSSITIASYIHVLFDDRGYCTSVAITNSSSDSPMVP